MPLIERRNFVLGATTLVGCASIFPSQALAEDISPGQVCASNPRERDWGIVDQLTPETKFRLLNAQNEYSITDYGTMMLGDRWTSSSQPSQDGKIVLGIYFLDGSDTQKDAVKNAAVAWLDGELGDRLIFDFSVDQNRSDIRIKFDSADGNWSKVGRSAGFVRKSLPTMNLTNWNLPHIVQHEFGHALGLRHEHRHPDIGIKFKDDVVIADMKRLHGWTKADTRRNILTALPGGAACVGDPDPNEFSIMMYDIPSTWTEDGKSYAMGRVISDRDRNCLVGVYTV